MLLTRSYLKIFCCFFKISSFTLILRACISFLNWTLSCKVLCPLFCEQHFSVLGPSGNFHCCLLWDSLVFWNTSSKENFPPLLCKQWIQIHAETTGLKVTIEPVDNICESRFVCFTIASLSLNAADIGLPL